MRIEKISGPLSGATGFQEVRGLSLSADRSLATFTSTAENVVSGAPKGENIYIRDLTTGEAVLVPQVAREDRDYIGPRAVALAPDGDSVAFVQRYRILFRDHPEEPQYISRDDVYVRDLRTGETTFVSVEDSEEGGGLSFSADGRLLAMQDGLRDLDTGELLLTELHMREPVISADGRTVAFLSTPPEGSASRRSDIFVHDRDTGETTLVTATSDGVRANRSADGSPVLSADGSIVAFGSSATNLVEADTNGQYDLFVRDLRTGEIARVNVASDGAQANAFSGGMSLSADGRFVAFSSYASNLVAGDTNDATDVFVHDRITGVTRRVSVAADGAQAEGEGFFTSDRAVISADGRTVLFRSGAANLVPDDGDPRGTDAYLVTWNEAATAGDDQAATAAGRVVAIDALADDRDPEGDRLTAKVVDGPDHGAVTTDADGRFVYTPDAGFVGVDRFEYAAHDLIGASEAATVAVTVRLARAGSDGADTLLGDARPEAFNAKAGDDLVNAGGGDDLVNGGDGADTLLGGAGRDILTGEAGDDRLAGGTGDDTLNGGVGSRDAALYRDAGARVAVDLALAGPQATGGAGRDLLTGIENLSGSAFGDLLAGDACNNQIDGGDGGDFLLGRAGNDRLAGGAGAGADRLTGGFGADILYGGGGADRFIYADIADSGVSTRDALRDFDGRAGDRIDLTRIDAVAGGPDDAFAFIRGAFSGQAGELRVVAAGANLFALEADRDGDARPDFALTLHTANTVAEAYILM